MGDIMRKEIQNQDTAIQADQELVKVKRKKRKRKLPLLIRIPIRLLVIILVCNFVVSFIRLGSGISELVYDYGIYAELSIKRVYVKGGHSPYKCVLF